MQNLQLLRQIGLKNTKHLFYLCFLKKQLFILKFLDNTPLFASVKLTEACNSKCITCSIDHIEKKPEPSTEQLLARKCPQCTCGWMINSIYEQL